MTSKLCTRRFRLFSTIFEIIDRRDVRQVALVVLQDVGDLVDRDVLFREIVLKIFEALDVLLHFFPLRIGHENDAIHAAQERAGVSRYRSPGPARCRAGTWSRSL